MASPNPKGRPKRADKASTAFIGTVPPQGSTKAPLAANVVQLEARRHSVKAWLDGTTVAGGEIRGGDALKAYKRWADSVAKGNMPRLLST